MKVVILTDLVFFLNFLKNKQLISAKHYRNHNKPFVLRQLIGARWYIFICEYLYFLQQRGGLGCDGGKGGAFFGMQPFFCAEILVDGGELFVVLIHEEQVLFGEGEFFIFWEVYGAG